MREQFTVKIPLKLGIEVAREINLKDSTCYSTVMIECSASVPVRAIWESKRSIHEVIPLKLLGSELIGNHL